MPITRCPGCGADLEVPSTVPGGAVECPYCASHQLITSQEKEALIDPQVIGTLAGFRLQGRQHRLGVVGDRRIEGRPKGATDIQLDEALEVVRMHQGAVVDVVTEVIVAALLDHPLVAIQGGAHGPVADRVHHYLEAGVVELLDVIGKGVRFDDRPRRLGLVQIAVDPRSPLK